MTLSSAPHTRTGPARRPSTPSPRLAAGVYGASGTSGAELVRLLVEHPHVHVEFATSRAEAGRPLDEIDPAAPPLALVHPEDTDPSRVDVVFLCVPHGTAGEAARRAIDAGARVIDVSGDHRLREAADHERVYASPRSQALADEAVYGLTEWARPELPAARLVANPGCYATAATLALAPLAEAGVLDDVPVIDAKSGVSGAGRTASATTHFISVSEDVRPYKVGRSHRHVAEIEQLLGLADPEKRQHRVVFTPHLVPLERGIEATITVRGVGSADDVRALLERRYADEPFVRVLPAGREARIRGVSRTNRAHLAVHPVEGLDAVVLSSAIDNLVKGAAGQAIQNFNLMFGLEEVTGLPGALPHVVAPRELSTGGDE
jgi:N-acetyl-gamma-glutamyl-phosphate reductase